MDRELYDYLIRWLALCEEWQSVFDHGANATRRTDGQMLNGIRNRMNYVLEDVNRSGYTLEQICEQAQKYGYNLVLHRNKLPPMMDEKYMKHADEIRADAKKAWEIYASSADYKYVQENIVNLSIGTDVDILKRIEKETDFVERLKWAIEKDYLPGARRYLDMNQYLGQLRRARELLEMRIDYIQPFK